MSWDESEHPRDSIGRFTFKNGGEDTNENKEENQNKDKKNQKNDYMTPFKLGVEYNETKPTLPDIKNSKESPADILYKNGATQKENANKKQRDRLIFKLGNKLTPKEILYSNVDELEKIKNNFEEKIKKSKILQKGTELITGKHHNKIFNNAIKLGVGEDTAGMLDLAHGDKMNDKSYLENAIELKNYDDSFIQEDKEYLEKKIEQQFKDYGFNKEEIKGYYFKSNSKPSKRISENEDFKEILKNNKDKILNNENFSGRFQKHGPIGIFNNNDLKNAIGGFDVRNPEFDSEGNLHLKIYDTYDFNKNADDFLNKAGRHEMEAGNLKPYFSIHDIIIPKDKIEEILK